MIVKKEGQFNRIEGIDVKIFSNDESHHISIHNNKNNTSLSFDTNPAGLKNFAEFIVKYLENN